MNLRKEIEKLIYWYIPTLLISSILGFVISAGVKGLDDTTHKLWSSSIKLIYS